MSPISIPGKVTLSQTQVFPDDLDAAAYVLAVEAADGQALEPAVRLAYNTFVKGCKQDNIWDLISGSCILAGARTLNGALVPLKGPSPANNNFVSGDYNRKTGLKGDGSTKYLDSNINNNSLPGLSKSTCFYATEIVGNNTFLGWRVSSQWNSYVTTNLLSGATAVNWPTAITAPTFGGASISGAVSEARCNGLTNTVTNTGSGNSTNITWGVFNRNGGAFYGAHRLSFYSISKSLDLALLDARVTTLMSDIGAAIP
jgi:hypothetical protein